MKNERTGISINLVGRPKEFIEKLLSDWAINIGRIIIVLTELVALSALGYRFIVDKQIIDLHDKIKTKESIVTASKNQEETYRDLQQRIAAISTLTKRTTSQVQVLNSVFEKTQSDDFAVERVSYSNNIISLDGTALSIFALNNLVTDIRKSDIVKSIDLTNIEGNGSTVEFKLQIALKTK